MRIGMLLLCAASCAAAQQQPYEAHHRAMGTDFALYLYVPTAERADEVSGVVFDEIDRLDDLLSNYKPQSELSRVNREAALHPVHVDPEMYRFLQESLGWSERSHGAFDITVGPAMKMWGFYAHQGRMPSEAEQEQMRTRVGWQHVHLHAADSSVSFDVPGVELDPGGIGKGFAVDSCIRLLRELGVTSALLSAGGSTVYALGAPPAQKGWKVIVRGPVPSRHILSTLTLRDNSFSAADCTQKHIVLNGVMYCHILEPHTLQPVRSTIQVALTDPSATASDAISNVLFVLGPQAARPWMREYAAKSSALLISNKGIIASIRWMVPINSGKDDLR